MLGGALPVQGTDALPVATSPLKRLVFKLFGIAEAGPCFH
jgi:hypothetical protein